MGTCVREHFGIKQVNGLSPDPQNPKDYAQAFLSFGEHPYSAKWGCSSFRVRAHETNLQSKQIHQNFARIFVQFALLTIFPICDILLVPRARSDEYDRKGKGISQQAVR